MSSLTFSTLRIPCAPLGPESCLPDLHGQMTLQNHLDFILDEYDEIYESYGQRFTSYPYRQQDAYTRCLSDQDVEVAILENQWARAEFLPGYGGRLWRLLDKRSGRDLLYTNDCLRASNLALRNAWFSGGVEWNCGVIGHSPYTMDRVFAARLDTPEGPVLRMYAYERIRGVVYQMDFWLDENSPALNAHFAVTNSTQEVTPMYWWTNIASPLYPGGRLLVPAHQAYTCQKAVVSKVNIPFPSPGVDVEHYESIPSSRDFFFSLDQGAPHWIANVDASGSGLLHSSSPRLQSRKLFVWGQCEGAQHWQEFLTQQAGPYLELQAGLGKTQYGCIPMAPHTTWEWSERFAPLQLSAEEMALDFDNASAVVSRRVVEEGAIAAIETRGHEILRQSAQLIHPGSGDAQLQDELRSAQGLPPLRVHLDWTSKDTRQESFRTLLHTGVLPEPPADAFPAWDPICPVWLEILRKSVRHPEGDHWYAWYCIALLEWDLGRKDLSREAIRRSLDHRATAANLYLHAALEAEEEHFEAVQESIHAGLALSGGNFSYAREALDLLARCGDWSGMLEEISRLPDQVQMTGRIRLDAALALNALGRNQEAFTLLTQDGGLVLDDVREGEISTGTLWTQITKALDGKPRPVPYRFNFAAIDPE